ncbi:MAG: c-type cytochrome, partial [Sandaracinaceae bacterium]|nr:c-type cytochrome [Sandaracinaceae bacterium]
MADKRKHDAIQGEILHEYDGILEADNLLPRWWLVTFYGTILFSAGYWFYYEAFDVGQHPSEQFAAVMAERAATAVEVTPELLASLGTDSERVSAGQQLFATNCAVCHGQEGQGNIGPNLTDNAWIHGGTAADIHTTVTNGVASAGMPPWGQTLGPQGVLNAVAFIVSIRNQNREGRPPQGTVVAEDGSPLPATPPPTEAPAPT